MSVLEVLAVAGIMAAAVAIPTAWAVLVIRLGTRHLRRK